MIASPGLRILAGAAHATFPRLHGRAAQSGPGTEYEWRRGSGEDRFALPFALERSVTTPSGQEGAIATQSLFDNSRL